MDENLPAIITAKALRLVSKVGVRVVLDRPSLRPSATALFYEVWRLVRGGPFEGEIGGIRMRFYDPGGTEAYFPSFFTGQAYEHSVVEHLKLLTPLFNSPTFLDVGAHYGYYSVYMAKLVGSTGKVFAFEPNGDYFKVLRTNVILNGLRNVAVHRLALSDMSETVVLEASKRMRARGFPTEKRKMRTKEAEDPLEDSVTAMSFDELATQDGIFPEIVKIDVHGGEGKVIAGMKGSLRHSISHLYCELHGEMSGGYTAKDIVGKLEDAGLEIFEFRGFRGKNGRLVALQNDLFSRPHDRMIYARK